MDLFSTAAALAGAAVPRDREIDGRDLSPVLLKNAAGREPEMFYYFGDELWAVRKGPWKLHLKSTRPASVEKWGNWPVEVHAPPLLFNVETDPQERFNLAAAQPDVAAALRRLLESHRASVKPGKPQR
jgi:arylsulfatase A-like enzyme